MTTNVLKSHIIFFQKGYTTLHTVKHLIRTELSHYKGSTNSVNKSDIYIYMYFFKMSISLVIRLPEQFSYVCQHLEILLL